MTECVAGGPLGQTGFPGCAGNRLLHDGFVGVIALKKSQRRPRPAHGYFPQSFDCLLRKRRVLPRGSHYARPGSGVKPKLTEVACWAHVRTALSLGRGLFFSSNKGGRTAAIRTRFMITCRRLQANLFAYLRDVLERIRARPVNRLKEPLPDNRKAAQPPRTSRPDPPYRLRGSQLHVFSAGAHRGSVSFRAGGVRAKGEVLPYLFDSVRAVKDCNCGEVFVEAEALPRPAVIFRFGLQDSSHSFVAVLGNFAGERWLCLQKRWVNKAQDSENVAGKFPGSGEEKGHPILEHRLKADNKLCVSGNQGVPRVFLDRKQSAGVLRVLDEQVANDAALEELFGAQQLLPGKLQLPPDESWLVHRFGYEVLVVLAPPDNSTADFSFRPGQRRMCGGRIGGVEWGKGS